MELVVVLIAYVGGLGLATILILSGVFLLRRERPRRALAVLICLLVVTAAMLIGMNIAYDSAGLIGTFETITVGAALATALCAGSMLWPWPDGQLGGPLIVWGFISAGVALAALGLLMQTNFGL